MKIFCVFFLSIASAGAFVTPCLHQQPRSHCAALSARKTRVDDIRSGFAAAALGCSLMFSSLPSPAAAETSRIIGQIQGSGLLFKDTLQIESFEDPKARGVTLYVSNFQRPITERLTSAKNFFSDPSYASVACAKTSPVVSLADNIARGPGGEEVFEESRSLLFKALRVQRIYDKEHNTLVYVSFNTRLDKNDDDNKSRFKSSLCVVPLEEPKAASTVATAAAAEPEPVAP